jgi:nicotinic acid mononucleotide adenylyltransferase
METFFLSNQSSLICARRGGETTRRGEEEEREFLSSLEVDRWVRQGKLKVVDLNENENENDEEKGSSLKGISSTEIRKFVKVGNWDKVVEMVPFPSVVEIIKRQGLYK